MVARVFRGKVVLIGNPAVGKTAISQVFLSDGREFPKHYNKTLAAEVNSKFIQIPGKADAVELLVFDSPSLDLYVDCLENFWNTPDLLMIVYDVTNKKSLEDVKYWYSIAMKTKWKGRNSSPIATVLFGNKTDLDKRRICSEDEGINVAENLDMKYFSGSAIQNSVCSLKKKKEFVVVGSAELEIIRDIFRVSLLHFVVIDRFRAFAHHQDALKEHCDNIDLHRKNNQGLEDPFRFLASEFYQFNLSLKKDASTND